MRAEQFLRGSLKDRARRLIAVGASTCLIGGGAAGLVISSATRAAADVQGPINFESYTTGSVNAQDGWSSSGGYDQAVTDNGTLPVAAPAGFGAQSLRISDAVTTQAFGDQTFSKPTTDEAGETGADAGIYVSGTRQSHFTAAFDFASVTPATEQPGLHISLSPDRGDGARMSYVRIEDSPTGWKLYFDDYQDVAPLGSGGNLDNGCGVEDDFTDTLIASNVSRSAHHLRFDMQFVPGPHNDIVKVSLDGTTIATGTSWEDYYRYCSESGGGTGGPNADQSRTVRSLLFREAGTADPGNAGKGFLIDGFSVASGEPCTTTCYVDANAGNDGATGQLGDPVKTIQEGVDLVSAGGIVHVAAGTYVENVTVPKGIQITGAGVTTVVEPAISSPTCAGGSSLCAGVSNVFLVQADDVTIDHLKIDGDNPALNGTVVGGANVDARNGIITNHPAGIFTNLSVHDVTVKNVFLRGIYASSGGTFNFTNNTVDNVQGEDNSVAIFSFTGAGVMNGNTVSNAGVAVGTNHSSGTQLTNNIVTASGNGVQSSNEGDGGGSPDVITGNNVSGCTGAGILIFVPYLSETASGNTVSGCSRGLVAEASCNLAGNNSCPGAVIPTATFSNNTVTGVMGGDGLFISTTSEGFGDGEVHANADHNTFSGPGRSVHVDETGTALATTTISRNALTSLVNDGATTVDARCNWWGSSTGPATGQTFGSVTGAPYLTTSNLNASCLPIASLSATSVSTVEGNSGQHAVTLTVKLNGPSTATAKVFWHTANGTAASGDYLGGSGTLTFAPGQTSKTINVNVLGDTTLEQNEYFFVDISAVSGVAIGTAQERIVILNDEKPNLLVAGPLTLTEGQSGKYILSLSAAYYLPVTVTMTEVNGTAHAGSDFTAVSATTTFKPGVTQQPLPLFPVIHTLTDGVTEGAETFKVKFTSSQILVNPTYVTVTIKANNT